MKHEGEHECTRTSRHKPGNPLYSTPAIFPTHNPLAFGRGGFDGSMEGKSGTPIREEGVRKGVNETGVIGTVIWPVYVE